MAWLFVLVNHDLMDRKGLSYPVNFVQKAENFLIVANNMEPDSAYFNTFRQNVAAYWNAQSDVNSSNKSYTDVSRCFS